MTLTEEQRAAIEYVISSLEQCGSEPEDPVVAKILQAMIDSSGTVEPTGGFDLEKARAADEALPYPLDANEIWVSGKGQMHINPPNAPSIFFTLSDLCEFRNLFHGQAAEIERLRAGAIEGNQFVNELIANCNSLRERVWKAEARIKELESSLGEAEALTKKNADLMNGYLRRIAELEDALVNERAWRICHIPQDRVGHWPRYEPMLQDEARQQLQAEGKIGPDATKMVDQTPNSAENMQKTGPDSPKMAVWQITEERKAAIWHAVAVLKENDPDDEHLWDEEIAVLRAMLTEAE